MNETNFINAMKPFFDKLDINELSFHYNEELNSFISDQTFVYEDEPIEFMMVVKIFKNIGTVVIGQSDGINFIEYKTIGQIEFVNEKWENML